MDLEGLTNIIKEPLPNSTNILKSVGRSCNFISVIQNRKVIVAIR